VPKPSIKLEAAKQAIAFPDFHSDELLELALTDPRSYNESDLPKEEQDECKREYRRFAFLGDTLIDSVLADYLYQTGHDLTQEDFDDWRQAVADRESLTDFAIELELPSFSSSCDQKNRKPPEEEQGTWGEMFEALVGVLFLDSDRNFDKVARWLCDRFLRDAIAAYEDDEDEDYDAEDTTVTAADYAEMMGVPGSWEAFL